MFPFVNWRSLARKTASAPPFTHAGIFFGNDLQGGLCEASEKTPVARPTIDSPKARAEMRAFMKDDDEEAAN